MSQNISLYGANYSNVPAVNLPKTGGGTASFTDVTDTTASAGDVAAGKYFYSAAGVRTSGTASGSTKNIWYGTCPTAAATQAKVATTDSSDFVLAEGNMVRIKFANAQTYNGTPTLNVDGTGAKSIYLRGTAAGIRYMWLAGEVVDFVYDGTNFVAVNYGLATTTYYGLTKLSASTSSTSEGTAATPSAVKRAYDLANGKQDALVSGTNIKTINGNSILGSGDLSVGGASVSAQTITILQTDWSSLTLTCSKLVLGVEATDNIIVSYAPASREAYLKYGIYCNTQTTDTLWFGCSGVPNQDVQVNVLIIR